MDRVRGSASISDLGINLRLVRKGSENQALILELLDWKICAGSMIAVSAIFGKLTGTLQWIDDKARTMRPVAAAARPPTKAV